VLGELRVGVEAGTGVVEIDMPARVEPRVVGAAQLVERRGIRVARMCEPERSLRSLQGGFELPVWG